MNLISIDPGKHFCYLALFQDGILVEVAKHKIDRTYLHSNRIRPFLDHLPLINQDPDTLGDDTIIDLVAYEKMHSRGGGSSGNVIQALIDVAFSTRCCLYDIQSTWHVKQYQPVYPHTWIGRAKKEINQPRILKRLSAGELKVLKPFENSRRNKKFDFNNNIVDAVGLGLWIMKR